MATGSVFENNRTQAVRLPAGTRFPGSVKKVRVRVLGCDRVLSPLDQAPGTVSSLRTTKKIFASNAANKVFKRKGSPLNDQVYA